MLELAIIFLVFWGGWMYGSKRPWKEFFPSVAKDLRKLLKKVAKTAKS